MSAELSVASWLPPALTAAYIALGVFGVRFYRKQNTPSGGHGAAHKMGGGISRAKAAWLSFAVLYWFFVAPMLALGTNFAYGWRMALLALAISMWVRGPLELLMMYRLKNWRPPYGIGHDLFTTLLVALLAVYFWPGEDAMGSLGGVSVAVALVSLVAETGYALVFHQLVAGATTGDDGIWFADATAPKFRRINRLTAIVNTPLYVFLVVLLVAVWMSGAQ